MILAVDPGFSFYGCAVFNRKLEPVKIELLETEKTVYKNVRVSDDDAFRVQKLSTELANVILKNQISIIVGELPVSGGQSEKAVKHMAYAASISNSVFAVLGKPVEWCSPLEVKKAVTGFKTASKTEIMVKISKLYNWEIKQKIINKKTGKTTNEYYPLGEKWSASKFEHIADAIGALHALKHSNLIRMITAL